MNLACYRVSVLSGTMFDHFIHLVRLKGRTRKLFMPVLAAAFAFLASRLYGGLLGLYDIARRRLGRIMRILLEPSHFVFQLLNAFEKRRVLLSQFSDNFIFFRPCTSLQHSVWKCANCLF